ncbi:28S ribosomal protein S29, mitochondrial isoform X1 [Strigops habroptila]|uniref:Small ribosomal subunit protein mS29 n=1 Tax=Strigops habroptila TaxID=2489341 RepID=A0A672TGK3_STRHB|nr:28S ribosomal protein S29, mitochondrial isoform X1 [Strigops habroptila]XP_030330099.1 28S ribosomal protein S29, mitochondrial isoform X1 [Strigops habroptila]
MLRSLKGLLSHPLKLDHGCALHMAAKDCLSAAASQDVQTPAPPPRAVFYTSENNPANHGEQHEGRHYSIPLEEVRAVFPHGLPYRFQQQIKTFNEAFLMVRKPALELFTYLKSSNFAHPAVRYVIYGEKGTGKTMTLCHVIHYCTRQGWLVLHIPDAHLWVKNCRELLQSSYKKERLDQPLQASSWLKNFKTSNERFLKEIKTQRKYVWGKREITEEGRPLGEVVEQGLARVRIASDAVGVVLKELKQQCHLGSFRLLVAVDGVNALWGRTTLKKEDKSPVSPEELTLVYNLRKMMMNDWTGGAIVTTLSQTGSLFKPSSAYLPQELLGKEGFDALDPFVPIPVPNYSPREFESCYRYYLDRKWLQHENARTEDGKEELRFLSGSNPRQLDRLAGPL